MNSVSRKLLYTLLSCILFSIGALYVALHNHWIIFKFPSYKKNTEEQARLRTRKKKVCNLSLWKNGRWQIEKTTLIWSDDITENITHLVNGWLVALYDEHITKKRVHLESVMVHLQSKKIYLSFDRSPLHKEWPVFAKWHLIESLLKTIRDNVTHIQDVHILVHHQPLIDQHLDFSQPWVLTGYRNS